MNFAATALHLRKSCGAVQLQLIDSAVWLRLSFVEIVAVRCGCGFILLQCGAVAVFYFCGAVQVFSGVHDKSLCIVILTSSSFI